ncbi:MAG: hypothetical protein J5486_05195 [Bacteroidaceae bacterium]|nr:hypothetical protein [Bacteroidaceae bacterium]
MRTPLVLLVATLLLIGCSDEDKTPYPSIITEPVMVATDDAGSPRTMLTDGGILYQLLNKVTGWPADTTFRLVGGYVVEGEGMARLMTAQTMYVLRDCTSMDEHHRDPTNVASAWTSGGYLNVHLLPKTQGKTQEWGYLRDSTVSNATGGTSHHISLYHAQTDDPTAFSGHMYISIPLDSIVNPRTTADSIVLSISTFTGVSSWQFSAR